MLRHVAITTLALIASATAHAVDWSKRLPHQHTSRFFQIHYQREGWDAKEFARFADAFVDLINRDFVKVDFAFPVHVLVLPDQPSFQAFVRKEFGDRNPPKLAIYLRAFKVFATFEGSGLGTFTNQIMQPFTDRTLADAPRWARAGIPTFFEKFHGYWNGDELIIQWGYHNPWRIEELGDKLPNLDLQGILSNQSAVSSSNNSDRRLVAVFLWQRGKLERFMRLIADRQRNGYGSYFEAAMGRPLKDIVPLWKEFLHEVATHRADALNIPPSTLFPNAATFNAALAQRNPWLQLQKL